MNTKTWTKDEVNKLHSVVADHEEKDWVTIADALGTGRSVATCLRQYRKKPLQKKDWQPEEDNRLREAMSMFGANWQSGRLHPGMYNVYFLLSLFRQSRGMLAELRINALTDGRKPSNLVSSEANGQKKKMTCSRPRWMLVELFGRRLACV